jgi:hypothetical protein
MISVFLKSTVSFTLEPCNHFNTFGSVKDKREMKHDDEEDPYVCGEVRTYISKTPSNVRWLRNTIAVGPRSLQLNVSCWWPKDLRGVDPFKICQYVTSMASMLARTPWARISSTTTELEVVIQLAPHRKRWCSASPSMGACNVNTGITTFGPRIGIRVYRMEDYAKVQLLFLFLDSCSFIWNLWR